MKKTKGVFFLIFISLSLVLTACSSMPVLPSREPLSLLAPINYDLALEFADFQSRANMKAESHETFSLTFLEPESIAGFSVRLENSVYSYSMEGISIDHKEESLPSADLPMLIFQSVQSLMKKSYTNFYYSDNVWSYEGLVSESLYFLTQNHETGSLVELRIPQRQLTVYFLPPSV